MEHKLDPLRVIVSSIDSPFNMLTIFLHKIIIKSIPMAHSHIKNRFNKLRNSMINDLTMIYMILISLMFRPRKLSVCWLNLIQYIPEFTMEIGAKEINFLDSTIVIDNCYIKFDTYHKQMYVLSEIS